MGLGRFMDAKAVSNSLGRRSSPFRELGFDLKNPRLGHSLPLARFSNQPQIAHGGFGFPDFPNSSKSIPEGVRYPPLDGPVVPLQDIIEVRHRPVPAARPKPLTSGRFSQGWPARLLRPALARRRPSIPPGLLRASTSRTVVS
jgi:hypothetical protein